MTRFARYSTKGIKKPPLDATPWSELAPPAAKQHSAAMSSPVALNDTIAADAADVAIPTTGLEKGLKEFDDDAGQATSDSSPKKKTKKNAMKNLSHPQTPLGDLDGSGSVPDQHCKFSPKMDGKKVKHGGKKVNNLDQSLNNIKQCLPVDSSDDMKTPDDMEMEDASASFDIPGSENAKVSTKKGMKRKNKDGSLLKKKKKCLVIDNGTANPPDMTEDLQNNNHPEQPAPCKFTPKTLNGTTKPPNKKKKQKPKLHSCPPSASGPPLLAEGPLMTQFEGYWVRRRAVPRLERVKAELAAAISDPQTLKREMKKRKRAEHRLLLSQLAARGARKPTSAAARLQGEADADEDVLDEDNAEAAGDGEDRDYDNTNNKAGMRGPPPPPSPIHRKTVAEDRNPPSAGAAPREERMVKFDGVWMTADAVGRLKELRRQLKMQRVSDVVLKQTMKTARRREEMKRKRDAKRVCLGCRQPGHFISECPHRSAGARAPVTGLCFRCGSTEHRLSECRRPADGAKLPYAVCFVCGQSGHLSRDCNLNPNGVYPKGGACKVCQRRDHLADDCPERREEEAAATAPRLATIGNGALEDDYQHDFREVATPAAVAAPVVRKPRQVRF